MSPSWAARSDSTSARSSASVPQALATNADRSAGGRSTASAKIASMACQRSALTGAPRRRAVTLGRRELPAEPRARRGPLALDGRRGRVQRLRRLLDAQADEVAELHHSRLARVLRGEAVERFVQRDDVHGVLFGGNAVGRAERQRAGVSAALGAL